MSIIKSMFFSLLQIAAVIMLYQGLAAFLVYVVPKIFPWTDMYDPVNGLNDAQAVLICLLIWDRFWGPTSTFLHRLSKFLIKKKKAH